MDKGRRSPPPLPLEEWLEHNIDFLLAQIPKVAAGKDYPLQFDWVTAAGRRYVFTPTGDDRDLDIAAFRRAMKTSGAIQYCIVCPFWSTPIDKPHRIECYAVICGDKARTISAIFDVRRDEEGKIGELIRRFDEEIDSSQGRFANPLIENE
jgi:hypothetical protein